MFNFHDFLPFEDNEFANLGLEQVGYIRRISGREIADRFPGNAELPQAIQLWALFGADGQPIVVSDHIDGAQSSAFDQDLEMVSLH